jgi:lipopolysaccharide export system permease protein
MITIKRADRLIALSVVGSILIVWLVLVGFDALNQLVRQLSRVGDHGYTVSDALTFIVLTLPRRMYQHFGSASLIGGLLGLGGLAASGELTALRAAGMSKFRLVLSVVAVTGALSLLVMLMGETLGPSGDQQANALQLRSRSGHMALTHGSGLWARNGDRVINARSAVAVEHKHGPASVRLVDVREFRFDQDGQLDRFLHARDATRDGKDWTLHQVRISSANDQRVHSTEKRRMPWSIQLDPRVLEQSLVHPEYLSIPDLRRNMHYLKANGLNAAPYANAFWGHILFPFNVLALVFCAMPFAFGSVRSGGLGRRVFIGILLAIGWYFLQRVITNMGMVYGVPALLANLIPGLILVLGAGVYFRRQS